MHAGTQRSAAGSLRLAACLACMHDAHLHGLVPGNGNRTGPAPGWHRPPGRATRSKSPWNPTLVLAGTDALDLPIGLGIRSARCALVVCSVLGLPAVGVGVDWIGLHAVRRPDSGENKRRTPVCEVMCQP